MTREAISDREGVTALEMTKRTGISGSIVEYCALLAVFLKTWVALRPSGTAGTAGPPTRPALYRLAGNEASFFTLLSILPPLRGLRLPGVVLSSIFVVVY